MSTNKTKTNNSKNVYAYRVDLMVSNPECCEEEIIQFYMDESDIDNYDNFFNKLYLKGSHTKLSDFCEYSALAEWWPVCQSYLRSGGEGYFILNDWKFYKEDTITAEATYLDIPDNTAYIEKFLSICPREELCLKRAKKYMNRGTK